MITYVLIVVLAVLIFLCVPDVVQVVVQAVSEWERANDLSKKHPARLENKGERKWQHRGWQF